MELIFLVLNFTFMWWWSYVVIWILIGYAGIWLIRQGRKEQHMPLVAIGWVVCIFWVAVVLGLICFFNTVFSDGFVMPL